MKRNINIKIKKEKKLKSVFFHILLDLSKGTKKDGVK